MAITLDSVKILKTYLNGVLGRADHHAKNVEGVSLALIGAILWKADGEIEVRSYAGTPGNIIWFYIKDKKYAMSYNHSDETIELKAEKHTGPVLAWFDNSTTNQEIVNFFKSL